MNSPPRPGSAALSPEALRAMFPALDRLVYLDTATAPPAATPVLQALRRVEDEWERGVFSWQSWEAEAHETRALFGRLTGFADDEVALVPSVAAAAATVARSLRPGRVVVGEREFQSNLFPWLMLASRGFDVVQVRARDGAVRTEDLADAVDGSTALLAVSETQSSDGFRVDLGALAERCRAAGALLFVNATQCLGAARFSYEEVRPDFLAAHGYKWLLGPRGAAWLAVRRERLGEIEPLAPNWKSVREPYADYYGVVEMAPGASRLDSSLAWFPWVGARAALEVILSLDPDATADRCASLAGAFRRGAEERGFACSPTDAPTQIVSLSGTDPALLRRRFEERGVVASVRGDGVRVGFHAYNDEADVEAALAALTED